MHGTESETVRLNRYRREAAVCRDRAARCGTIEATQFIKVAEEWERLAQEIEKRTARRW